MDRPQVNCGKGALVAAALTAFALAGCAGVADRPAFNYGTHAEHCRAAPEWLDDAGQAAYKE